MSKKYKYKNCDISINAYQSSSLPNGEWVVDGLIAVHAEDTINYPFCSMKNYKTKEQAEDDFEKFAENYIDNVVLLNFRPIEKKQ